MAEQGSCNQDNSNFEAPRTPQEPRGRRIQTGRLREVVNFVRATPSQQLLAAINLAGATVPRYLVGESISQRNDEVGAIFLTVSTLINLSVLGFNEVLAVGNYLIYRQVRQALARHGWDERIIEPKSYSWCQRNAARTAAIDNGYGDEINQYFREQGYKWYHIIPYTRSKNK